MIKAKVKNILEELPPGVDLVAAVKGRDSAEVEEALNAGVEIIGENYLKEARRNYQILGSRVRWHFIGHLQTNKVRKAVKIFDMIETMDSLRLAETLNFECARIKKKMPVLIEINSAAEKGKYGILPEEAISFIKKVKNLSFLQLSGLMTMGPFSENLEEVRPYLRSTRVLFGQIKERYGDELKNWHYLSMGMSATYKVAIEEGANIVRVGTAIFGSRPA